MILDVASAIRLSLLVGLGAAALGFVPATAVAWLLARGTFRGKSLLSALVLAPLVLPPVVTGLLLLRVFGRASPLGAALDAIGLPVPFTLLGAVLAALVVGFPIYVMTIRGAIEAVDRRYEEVSLSLGVPPARTAWRVTLPLALPGVVAGVVLAFARGLGEFGATAIIAGNMEGRTRTIALAVYALLDAPRDDPRTAWLVAASVALAFVALVGFEGLTRWQRRRLELDGR
ncbi:MAG: molybdate ABC transporter permease subunit [Pseudomonadota bacterium]|nr:molybdate ABC transporter permease subunit [Pseudomonadota bacterium]